MDEHAVVMSDALVHPEAFGGFVVHASQKPVWFLQRIVPLGASSDRMILCAPNTIQETEEEQGVRPKWRKDAKLTSS